jgi:hypothetical protein
VSSSLRQLLEELDRQKRAYHEKMLSVDGEWSLFMRSFQVYDFLVDIANLLIPEFYFASLSSSFLFGLDLTDLEPLNLEFTWRFPTLEEWLRGVGVVIEKIVPDYAVSLEEFIRLNIKEAYQQPILATVAEKGYYGISRYGYSYYDPRAVREFLRSGVALAFRKHPSVVPRRTELETLARSLGVLEGIARDVHDRISMVVSAHTECFILDYGLLDVSRLCEAAAHSEELGVVPFVDYDGVYREAEILTLADMQSGCVLDLALLDYCFLAADEDIYRPEAGAVVDALEDKLARFRARVMLTTPALANYVRGDEAADYHRCERTNVWGELVSMRYAVEHEAEVLLRQMMPGLDPMAMRKYKTAVLQLMGHLGKRHRWGYGVYKAMEEPQLRDWWVGYWERQGLDRSMLEQLYESARTWLPALLRRKMDLGKKLRLERLGVPLE